MSISPLVERALPLSPEILEGIATGALQIFGGTLRDAGGRIVKHLIFPDDSSVALSDRLKEELSLTLSQAQNDAMQQLSRQVTLLSAVNLFSARQQESVMSQQLDELGRKIDALDQKTTLLLEAVNFSQLLTLNEIKSRAIAAIEEAIYASQKQSDLRFIRLHIVPLRRVFSELDMLLGTLLTDLTNRQLIENIHFVMLIAELKNRAAFVLGQTHIHLQEDALACGYFERNGQSNHRLRDRLAGLKQTGSFSPHILTREALDTLKLDIARFKQLENQARLLADQTQLALSLKIPTQALLHNRFSQIQMLEPIVGISETLTPASLSADWSADGGRHEQDASDAR